jgi:hypothetical protein
LSAARRCHRRQARGRCGSGQRAQRSIVRRRCSSLYLLQFVAKQGCECRAEVHGPRPDVKDERPQSCDADEATASASAEPGHQCTQRSVQGARGERPSASTHVRRPVRFVGYGRTLGARGSRSAWSST